MIPNECDLFDGRPDICALIGGCVTASNAFSWFINYECRNESWRLNIGNDADLTLFDSEPLCLNSGGCLFYSEDACHFDATGFWMGEM
jgi:hypothetical protein